MKKWIVLTLFAALLLVGCGAAEETAVSTDTPLLTIVNGDATTTYTAADLEALSSSEASFRDVAYVGVPLTALLEASSVTMADVRAVKAVASDGFSANYDLPQIQKEDVIVAYAQADGPLTDEDGAFRMVMPDEDGKMNVRQLVEIQAIQ